LEGGLKKRSLQGKWEIVARNRREMVKSNVKEAGQSEYSKELVVVSDEANKSKLQARPPFGCSTTKVICDPGKRMGEKWRGCKHNVAMYTSVSSPSHI
jgi:hypothetical protein